MLFSPKTIRLAVAASLLTAHAHAAAPDIKHDSQTPIEVTSDTLEVFQQENRAVFTGHVVAIQGDVRLKADAMTVHYKKPAENADAPKEKSKASEAEAAVPGGNGIQRIDADGNVFLSTAEETASGLHGIYDVEHQEIHLIEKVVLTRGQNTLKGQLLVYNFKTGKSTLTGQGTSQQPGKERVRALFVPGDKKDEKK